MRGGGRPNKPKYATPEEEWAIVVNPEEGKDYSSGRKGTPLAVYEEKMKQKNSLLQAKGHDALLVIEEVVSVRLCANPLRLDRVSAASL